MTTDNLIVIKGGAYNDIKKALRQWIELYSKDLQDGLTFQLFKNVPGCHIIQADKRLDNERFFYLINYLEYPEGIDYKIDIEGYTTGKENNRLKGRSLLVYISQTDEEYDNVFVTTPENENFKVDFGGKITETREKKFFKIPNDFILENPETIKVSKKEIIQKEDKALENKLDKRFKVLSLTAFSLLLIGIFIDLFYTQVFIKYSFFLGMGIGLWFFTDYKMLQSDNHFNYCSLIAIVFLIIMTIFTGESNTDFFAYGWLYPLTVLIIQKPARLIYKAILKREPVVDRPPPTFWDGVYMTILFFGFAILPFVFMSFLIK